MTRTFAVVALVLATSLDVLSTLWSLRAGGVEVQGLWRLVGGAWIWLRIAFGVLAAVLVWRDPSTLALAVAFAVAAAWLVIALINFRNARRLSRRR